MREEIRWDERKEEEDLLVGEWVSFVELSLCLGFVGWLLQEIEIARLVISSLQLLSVPIQSSLQVYGVCQRDRVREAHINKVSDFLFTIFTFGHEREGNDPLV
jgi:hypothetical protein